MGRTAILLGVLFLWISARTCDAVEYTVVPSLFLREQVNTNLLMTAAPHDTIWEYSLSPSVRGRAAMEQWEVSGDLSAVFSRFWKTEELDANDLFLKLSARYKGELDTFGLEGSSAHDSTWRSELQETGLVLGTGRRDLQIMNLTWNRVITERLSGVARYQFGDARYSHQPPGLFNYQSHLATYDLTYALSEREQVTGGAQLLSYQSSDAGIESNVAGVQFGFVHAFSETFHGTLLVGAREMWTTLSIGEFHRNDRESGWLTEGTVDKRFERTQLQGSFSRRVDPSGAGYLLQVDHLWGSVDRSFTENTAGHLAAHFYQTHPLRNDLPISDSHSYSVEPRWSWKWAELWEAVLSYRYAAVTNERSNIRVASHSISGMLTYHGPVWTSSR